MEAKNGNGSQNGNGNGNGQENIIYQQKLGYVTDQSKRQRTLLSDDISYIIKQNKSKFNSTFFGKVIKEQCEVNTTEISLVQVIYCLLYTSDAADE